MSRQVVAGVGDRQLVLEFQSGDDRHRHRVLVAGADGAPRLALESIEGDGEMRWPPSPPLQQLLIESRPAGEVALLVGMAGRAHWSLSVEASDGGLRFDVACRTRESPEQLGSFYRIHDGRGWTLSVEPNAVCRRTGRELQVAPAPPWTTEASIRWGYWLRLEEA